MYNIDKECIDLVNALNEFDGISTYSACSGHGKNHFSITFFSENTVSLKKVLKLFDPEFMAPQGWKVEVFFHQVENKILYWIIGPKELEKISKDIEHIVKQLIPKQREV